MTNLNVEAQCRCSVLILIELSCICINCCLNVSTCVAVCECVSTCVYKLVLLMLAKTLIDLCVRAGINDLSTCTEHVKYLIYIILSSCIRIICVPLNCGVLIKLNSEVNSDSGKIIICQNDLCPLTVELLCTAVPLVKVCSTLFSLRSNTVILKHKLDRCFLLVSRSLTVPGLLYCVHISLRSSCAYRYSHRSNHCESCCRSHYFRKFHSFSLQILISIDCTLNWVFNSKSNYNRIITKNQVFITSFSKKNVVNSADFTYFLLVISHRKRLLCPQSKTLAAARVCIPISAPAPARRTRLPACLRM